MKNSIYTILMGIFCFAFFSTIQAQQDQLPVNPDPGKCYVKCVTPDEMQTTEERYLFTPGYTTLEFVPAVYETVDERVLIKEATKKFIYHPAEYETVDVSYVSKQDAEHITIVPAKLSPGSQRIEVEPQHANWDYMSYSGCKSPDPLDCQVVCWKEIPARFETVATQLLDADANFNKSPIPEVTATYKKQVVKKAAWVEEIPIEAEYAVIKKQVVKTPASVRTTNVEPVHKSIAKNVMAKRGGITSWEEIDCKLTGINILPIFWDYNSAALTEDAKKVVDEALYKLLKERENISIELASHTDARGNDDYNLTLSQRRADAIKNYLATKGISNARMTSKGYGETRLVNNCDDGVVCTETQHQQNRRTEFRVLGIE